MELAIIVAAAENHVIGRDNGLIWHLSGCVRVEFDQDFHYCSGEVCHTPKELFNILADDYRTYVEIELTKGRRELTEDDEREADALCKRYLERCGQYL